MSTDKVKIRDDILASVSRNHAVSLKELMGASRSPEAVAARADAAQRLSMAGFRGTRIAQILKRDRTVVDDYLHGRYRGGRDDGRFNSLGAHLPLDIRHVILETARLSRTTPEVVIAEWLRERAQYELDAKSRENQGRGAVNYMSRVTVFA